MSKGFRILIADRNRNIREFLKQELTTEGYTVHLANNGKDVLKMIDAESPDLLIIDLDTPYLDELEFIEQLQNKKRHIPVIIHTFLAGYKDHPVFQTGAVFVEKNGTNINALKAMIASVFLKHYPDQFE